MQSSTGSGTLYLLLYVPRLRRVGLVDRKRPEVARPIAMSLQLVHQLLQDILVNLQEHYRRNFKGWVRKWCRVMLEVGNRHQHQAAAAADDDDDDDDDDEDEEEAEAEEVRTRGLAGAADVKFDGH